ncbi:uncharacterized protein EI97DRAFT_417912 [Westerdykella ornata]|uniref:Rhodopsin domain-containing protein n=1 Tax=Westerdykella ornata TaxID=318751 RepID=A0A6A6JKS9_WESOR|nr:uncharacterized protein EI97DRAFT_417912 [Westerdykella ornata]KAF2276835.1 hypothetical protein EI97DRAFT_417912 [Westerdykella ornata]
MATEEPIPNRGPILLAVNIAFLSAAVVSNALRCYVRIRMVRGFGVDDWLMAAATAALTCYCTFSMSGVVYGSGHHHRDLKPENIERAMNYWWLCMLFYAVSMVLSKLSIGWFLLRIAVKRAHAWAIYFSMLISVVVGVIFFFVTLFQCSPIPYFWRRYTLTGKCMSIEVIVALGYLYSAFSIISDFTFAILPVFLVWNLQLNTKTKWALIPLLTMGCIASSAVVARVPYMGNFRHEDDFLWATTDIAIWSTVEQGLAITAGSLATLRPLFTLILARLGLSTGPSKLTSGGARPSHYGHASRGSAHVLGGGGGSRKTRMSKELLDQQYGLRSLTETTCTKGAVLVGKKNADVSNVNRIAGGGRGDGESEKSLKGSGRSRSGSEEELNASVRTEESSEERGMQIVVSTSFMVSEKK